MPVEHHTNTTPLQRLRWLRTLYMVFLFFQLLAAAFTTVAALIWPPTLLSTELEQLLINFSLTSSAMLLAFAWASFYFRTRNSHRHRSQQNAIRIYLTACVLRMSIWNSVGLFLLIVAYRVPTPILLGAYLAVLTGYFLLRPTLTQMQGLGLLPSPK